MLFYISILPILAIRDSLNYVKCLTMSCILRCFNDIRHTLLFILRCMFFQCHWLLHHIMHTALSVPSMTLNVVFYGSYCVVGFQWYNMHYIMHHPLYDKMMYFIVHTTLYVIWMWLYIVHNLVYVLSVISHTPLYCTYFVACSLNYVNRIIHTILYALSVESIKTTSIGRC